MRIARVIAVAASLGPIAAASGTRGDQATVEQALLTPHYRIVLQIGPAEAMYTVAEAHLHHPSSGEIMLGGSMDEGMSGVGHAHAKATASDRRHVELHVFSRPTGKVVMEAHVTISIAGADNKWNSVPIARMYGIVAGPDDMHYGNNWSLPPGGYRVRASVNGERARFVVSLE